MPLKEQEALVEWVRRSCRDQRKVDAAHNTEVAAYVKSKAKTSSEIELQELITEWAYGMSFFERWQERGVRSVREISAGIGKLTADTDAQLTQVKLDWLREQIEMRTRGLQWVDFATRWSSTLDSGVGTVGDLTGHLKELVEEEQERRAAGELPEAAPAPVSKRKTFKELGTPTAQAEELALQRVELTPEELRVKAEIERDRLEAIGEIDTVADQQPEDAPSFSSLPTRRIEVRWRYYVKDATRKSGRRTEYIWTGGEVQHANPSSRIALHRIASHRIPSHPVSSRLIPSHPVPSRPIPSHPVPSQPNPPDQSYTGHRDCQRKDNKEDAQMQGPAAVGRRADQVPRGCGSRRGGALRLGCAEAG